MSSDSPIADRSTPPRVSQPLADAVRDRYEIIRETGQGASATVYLARDRKHGRLVALKTLNPDVAPTVGERFLREIQVAAGMQHPNILPMYDSGMADGRLYFVMPFVDGGSLRQRLEATPQMPIDDALRAAHDVAIALAFAHDQGVVHRDVKPENILFYHGRACLADFGVARVMEQLDIAVTGHGMVVGTPAYMSPEQLTHGGFDGRSDVYSLACVLYEAIGGVPAFAGSTPQELLRQRLRNPPPPLRAHRQGVPASVDDLLVRALSAVPDSRFPDARGFAEAIEHALQDVQQLTTSRRLSGAVRITVGRHPVAWAWVGVLVIALGALAAVPLRSSILPRSTRASAVVDVSAVPAIRAAVLLERERRVATDGFRAAAVRLTADEGALRGRDSLLADGLVALGQHAYPRACAAFDRMRVRDSLDAAAWYGLGDCQMFDSVVVRDARSPSRFAFRSSWTAALAAYLRAATIDSTVYHGLGFTTLAALLPTTGTVMRGGHLSGEAAITFAAHPAIDGDTIAFTPYRLSDVIASRPETMPPTLPDALRRNRDQLVRVATRWAATAPGDADALEALAAADEARGLLADDSLGAEGALRRATALTRSPAQRVRLASMEVRLRLKGGDFEGARALSDSLLDAWAARDAPADIAERLEGLAAFTGRIALAARLRARTTAAWYAGQGIAPPVSGAVARLFERGAAGVCDDSLMAVRRQLDTLLESYAPPNRRDGMRTALIERPMSLAYPCLGGRALTGWMPLTPLDRAQRALAAGRRAETRAVLDSVERARTAALPGDVSLDYTFQEAWLRAAAGDSAGAIRRLDRVLDALPTLGTWAVREDAQAAAIGRTLLLRAELAAAAGDSAVARRRAREALAVWKHADPALASSVARARTLAPGA